MKKKCILLIFFLSALHSLRAQPGDTLYSFHILPDVTVTIDRTITSFHSNKTFILVFYALPNGNTTAQTMGKRMQPGDDWHYDIQHIRAQTDFVRRQLPDRNIVVAYLENDYKSWPTWKQYYGPLMCGRAERRRDMSDLRLAGCTPEPLMNYLKALGLFRAGKRSFVLIPRTILF